MRSYLQHKFVEESEILRQNAMKSFQSISLQYAYIVLLVCTGSMTKQLQLRSNFMISTNKELFQAEGFLRLLRV